MAEGVVPNGRASPSYFCGSLANSGSTLMKDGAEGIEPQAFLLVSQIWWWTCGLWPFDLSVVAHPLTLCYGHSNCCNSTIIVDSTLIERWQHTLVATY